MVVLAVYCYYPYKLLDLRGGKSLNFQLNNIILLLLVTGWLVDTTGSYTAAFLLCGLSMIFSSLLLGFARLIKKMKKKQLRFLAKESDPKLQLWANGSVAYSVASELDKKDGESVAIVAEPGYNST